MQNAKNISKLSRFEVDRSIRSQLKRNAKGMSSIPRAPFTGSTIGNSLTSATMLQQSSTATQSQSDSGTIEVIEYHRRITASRITGNTKVIIKYI